MRISSSTVNTGGRLENDGSRIQEVERVVWDPGFGAGGTGPVSGLQETSGGMQQEPDCVKTQARCPWWSLNLGFLLCKNRDNSARGLSWAS